MPARRRRIPPGAARLMPRPAASPARTAAAGPGRLIKATWAASDRRGRTGPRLPDRPTSAARAGGERQRRAPPAASSGNGSSAPGAPPPRRRWAGGWGRPPAGRPLRRLGGLALPACLLSPQATQPGGSHLPRAAVREGACPPSQRGCGGPESRSPRGEKAGPRMQGTEVALAHLGAPGRRCFVSSRGEQA